MQFDIYIIGGGQKMVDFLNSVAMYANANGIALTAAIAFAFGIFWMMGANAVQQIKTTDVLKYMLGTMLFVSVAINKTVDTYVTDPIDPEVTMRRVSNIPLGLAFLTSVSTKIDYAVTQGMESVFSTPNDLAFSQSGMMIAQDMLIKASRKNIADYAFKTNMNGFLQNCVLYDVQMGHYTLDQVLNSEDMWGFFMENAATESRAFRYDDNWETCKAGLTALNAKWNTESNNAVLQFAKEIFPYKPIDQARAALVSLMPVSYETVVGVSDTAANLLRQNMMINMFYDSVGSFNMTADNVTASQAYVEARAELQTINNNLISGQQSGKWLIYMKTTLLLILVGVFVLMAPFAALPGGWSKFVKTYAGLFFMICLWGPIYALLNYIQLSSSIDETRAIATGLTGMTQSGIAVVNARIASNAATFFGYVPYLAILLTGIGSGMAHMLQSGLSSASSAASAVANDVTTGSINLGNTNQGVHAFNNVSGNKFDTSGSYRDSGTMTTQMNNGNLLTQFGNGNSSLDTSQGYSKLDSAGLSNKESTSQTLNKEGSRLIESGKATSADYSEKRGAVISGGVNNSLNRFDQKSQGGNWNYGEDSRESQAARNISSMAKRMSEQFSISEADSRWILGQAYAEASAGRDFGIGSVSVGGRMETGRKQDWNTTDLSQWVKDNMKSEEFNSSMETLFNASKGQTITENNGVGIDGRTTYGESADWAKTRIDSAKADIRTGESYKEASAQMANTSFDFNQNYQQKFYDWLKSDDGKSMSVSDLNELFSSKNMDEVKPLAREFMSQETDKIFKDWQEQQQLLGDDFKTPSKESVNQTYKTNADTIGKVNNDSTISNAYTTTSGAEDLKYDDTAANNDKSKIEKGLSDQSAAIDNSKPTNNPPTNPDQTKDPKGSSINDNDQKESAPEGYGVNASKAPSTSYGVMPGQFQSNKPANSEAMTSDADKQTPSNKNDDSLSTYSLKQAITGDSTNNPPPQHEKPQPKPQTDMPTFSGLLDFAKSNLQPKAEEPATVNNEHGFSLYRPGEIKNDQPTTSNSAETNAQVENTSENNIDKKPLSLEERMQALTQDEPTSNINKPLESAVISSNTQTQTDQAQSNGVNGSQTQTDQVQSNGVNGGQTQTDQAQSNGVNGGQTQTDQAQSNGVNGGQTQTDQVQSNGVNGGQTQTDQVQSNGVNGGQTQTDQVQSNGVNGGQTQTDQAQSNGVNESSLQVDNQISTRQQKLNEGAAIASSAANNLGSDSFLVETNQTTPQSQPVRNEGLTGNNQINPAGEQEVRDLRNQVSELQGQSSPSSQFDVFKPLETPSNTEAAQPVESQKPLVDTTNPTLKQ